KGTERIPTETLQGDRSLTAAPGEEKTQKLVALSEIQNSFLLSSPTTQQEKDQIAEVVTQNLEISSIPTLVLTSPIIAPQRNSTKPAERDPWLLATLLTACLASISSLWYFFHQHMLLAYGDAYSHLLIARRLFDNPTPSLAQLGGVWLPLPH